MTDANLRAFAEWCRTNHRNVVFDPVILRRVFTAYDQAPDYDEAVEEARR